MIVLPQGVQGARPPAAPSCSAPSQRSLCKDVEKLRDPSDNFLDGSFLTRCWTNDSMAGNPANAPSIRSTWLSRQLTIPLVVVLFLTIVRGLVYSGCPRSCLMALSDRGHPYVSSSGPIVPIVIKKRAGGVSPPRVSRGTPSRNTDEKESERRRRR